MRLVFHKNVLFLSGVFICVLLVVSISSNLDEVSTLTSAQQTALTTVAETVVMTGQIWLMPFSQG